MPYVSSDLVLRWFPRALAAIALRELTTASGLPVPAVAWNAFAFLAYAAVAIALARGAAGARRERRS